MSRSRIWVMTFLALIAFAGNSLLCRLALKETSIDPASFTSARLISGALVLWVAVRLRGTTDTGRGNWLSAFALFVYATAFSFAYVSLTAGTGALLLFGAVQATMIGYGLWKGERLHRRQTAGFIVALAGLVGLLLPGLAAPPLLGAVWMLVAGLAWGIYSLLGRFGGDATKTTADNFLRAVPLTVALGIAASPWVSLDRLGLIYALASGALASGAGYAIWYTALKGLKATEAASVQLAVPVLAAIGGVVVLNEPVMLRSVLASIAVLGGIALVTFHEQAEREQAAAECR